jgi:hypothetical protein
MEAGAMAEVRTDAFFPFNSDFWEFSIGGLAIDEFAIQKGHGMRRSSGDRDDAPFFLRIQAAVPRNPRSTNSKKQLGHADKSGKSGLRRSA